MDGPDRAQVRAERMTGRVTVDAMDVAGADYHDLEVDLPRVAEGTGGFSVKTNRLPERTVGRIEDAMAGRCMLVVADPGRTRGEPSCPSTW